MELSKVGPYVRLLRNESGMTQAELGEKAGLSMQTVHQIESAKTYSLRTINALLKVLDCRLDIRIMRLDDDDGIIAQ